MKKLKTIIVLTINVLFFVTVSAQEAVTKNKPHTSFDLQKPVHSIGFLWSENASFIEPKYKNRTGTIQIKDRSMYFSPKWTLKYSCAIKNGWGITAEIPFGVFDRYVRHGYIPKHIADTLPNGWSEDYTSNEITINTCYLGFSLKASHLANVHKNISLQSEVGLTWLPFLTPAKKAEFEESESEFVSYEGYVYMNCMPSISAASYAVPDLAFAFNVLVHGKNPSHNFVFGINGNISFMDRVHFKYQTTDVLPAHLQSSGEFGWRMSSIGFHVGYQWMTGKKKVI